MFQCDLGNYQHPEGDIRMQYAAFASQTFDNMLGTLDHLLAKAIESDMSDTVLEARLADDMFPLELQFRVAINQALLALQQVGIKDVPLEEESYASLAEVRDRVAAVRARVAESNLADWSPATGEVDLTLPNGVRFVMSAEEDIRDWILPNFYFHMTLAYALLRREGLEIGKMDFLPHMERHMVRAT